MGRRGPAANAQPFELGRRCRFCDRALVPKTAAELKVAEPPSTFNGRRFCSTSCAGKFARMGARPGALTEDEVAMITPIKTGFPGAAFTGDEPDLPTTCAKCGNALRLEPTALACIVCSRRYYVESWLRLDVERHGFGHPETALDERRPAPTRTGFGGPPISTKRWDQV